MTTTCGKCGWQLGVDFDDTPLEPIELADADGVKHRFEGGNAYEVGCEDYH